MREKRIIQWVTAVIIAAILFGFGRHAENKAAQPTEYEKQAITVNAPDDMEDSFNYALKVANLDETHKIVMTQEDNANICIGYAKQDDESYERILYSPFVIAYSTSDDCQKQLKKADVLVESPYNDEFLEIDFLKVINEAIGEGKWANLGLKDEAELKVFYPSEESIYWHDFYDFLLVTVNDGKYPKTEMELRNAENIIKKFLESQYTEGVTDFYEQIQRTGGFPDSAIYVLTEKDALDFAQDQSKYTYLYYPQITVYFNYYIKGDEIGKQIIEILGKSKDEFIFTYDFYKTLANERYRSTKYSELEYKSGYAEYERDIYNVAKIPGKVEPDTTTPTIPTETKRPESE